MGGEFGTVTAAARQVVDVGVRAGARASGSAGAALAPATQAALAEELAGVAARYVPDFGSMAASDVARGRALVQDALDGLQVVPVVNRWHRPGVPPVTTSDAFMGTVHTLPPRNAADRVMRFVRRHWEQSRGFHGPGELAGHTVFASAQFVPRGDVARHGGDVVAALGERAAARGGWGIARFGDEAYVLDPSTVLARATATGRDSGLGPNAALPATLDRMDDVVLERLAGSHGFRRDLFQGANDYRIGVDGVGSAAARRESLRHLLHDTPHDEAVERLRGYLTGPTMTSIDHMVELQVRGVRGSDVLAVVPEPAAATARPVGI